MRHETEDRIGRLARRQHGVVTRTQLLDLGLGARAIGRRVESRRLRPLHRGVYLVGPVQPPRAREMAAVLACGPGVVLSHRTAAGLWNLTTPPGHAVPVDLSAVRGHGTRRSGIRLHRIRALPTDERITRDRLPVTSPGRTLLDLAAVLPQRDLERAVGRAERERLATPARLDELLARHPHRPGAPALRAVLAIAGGPAFTRSEAEALFLELIRAARLPVPETNAKIAGCEVDFLWRDERVVVEVDGYRHHGVRPRFESDRRRTTHLAAHGILVIPVTWRQIVEDGTALAVQIGRALLLAGQR